MKRQALDIYDELPEAMTTYLKHYGWHFSKKAYEWAVKHMRTRNNTKPEPITRETFDETMKKYGITLENDTLYDGMFMFSMAKSKYHQSSMPSEQSVAIFVKDTIDEADAPDGAVFATWYAKCVRAGIPIDWDEML